MNDDLAEKRELKKLDEQVTVMFQTTADLLANEMTDEDWIELGKFVAQIAADVRLRAGS